MVTVGIFGDFNSESETHRATSEAFTMLPMRRNNRRGLIASYPRTEYGQSAATPRSIRRVLGGPG